MPYLKMELRQELGLGGFIDFRNCMEGLYKDEDWAGSINYLNYVILKDRMKREKGQWQRYWKFAMWVGTMICCVLEVYRRVIAPYEEDAIEKNGDVR